VKYFAQTIFISERPLSKTESTNKHHSKSSDLCVFVKMSSEIGPLVGLGVDVLFALVFYSWYKRTNKTADELKVRL